MWVFKDFSFSGKLSSSVGHIRWLVFGEMLLLFSSFVEVLAALPEAASPLVAGLVVIRAAQQVAVPVGSVMDEGCVKELQKMQIPNSAVRQFLMNWEQALSLFRLSSEVAPLVGDLPFWV